MANTSNKTLLEDEVALLKRELEIEAALERVRCKTMVMHNSSDVADTVLTLHDEILKLGIDKSIRCGIGILEGTEHMETWSANASPDGKVNLKIGRLNMTIHPMLIGVKKAWKKKKKTYSYEFTEKDVLAYYTALNQEPEYAFNADIKALPNKEIVNVFFFASGTLFAFTSNPISNKAANILSRFANVFGQTYRRYLDLQKAESSAREAVIQASVDRVRGQIASMRIKEDLNKITPLVWNELKTLKVPFFRCGVFIVDEHKEQVEVYLASSEGQALGVLNLPFNSNELTTTVVQHWRKKSVYHLHWNQEEFLNWMQMMVKAGQVTDQQTYQGMNNAPESLNLQFVPFTQGFLYVGSVKPLKEAEIDLVKLLADSFAIAYARYEDFVKLEKAKYSIEMTLKELKATQAQLIQSEKMASLGELTAGIAHEIQNPLNFVNNFSEVSEEMIDELDEELEKGDLEEVKAISSDLKQNLSKIYHHGQRASSIVKGMLEHSRTSSGKIELTDINALVDEYLRLSYHGLRAKDKSFNADFKTTFDPTLPKIEVIPQDIGRVLLNLINNAFQAVNEQSRKGRENYNPKVSISTSQELTANGQKLIAISITDNGPGIADEIKDKIFQPFFTTKETGKGTGLGLSLAYDIVKVHGAEIKVESEVGAGSKFSVELPISKTE